MPKPSPGGRRRFTDYKTGRPVSAGKKAEKIRSDLLAAIRSGSHLQVAAYLLADPEAAETGEPPAIARYLYLKPDVPDGSREVVVGADEAVMRCDLGLAPVAPASTSADSLRIAGELLRPGHEPIGFAEGVGGDRVAAQIDFVAMAGEQGAPAQQPSVAVAPGA